MNLVVFISFSPISANGSSALGRFSNSLTMQNGRPQSLSRRIRRIAVQCTQVVRRPLKSDPKRPTVPPQLAADGDCLITEPFQVAMVSTHFALCAALAIQTVTSIEFINVGPHLVMAGLSYLFSDFTIGLYHHAVDNYGSPDTPIFGCTFTYFVLQLQQRSFF